MIVGERKTLHQHFSSLNDCVMCFRECESATREDVLHVQDSGEGVGQSGILR